MSAALPAEVKAGGRRAAGRTASRIVCMTTEDEFRRNEKIVAQQQANENARHPETDCRAFFWFIAENRGALENDCVT
ncbi:hypothetical protein [Burkholderia pseudomallei]|uniref:hypothetical protein n=1 Tax=Burkholderia pseudomallei TaxID=28450 RepID=UPI000536C133|nr:hypothetical protein [Burkholderia pseudomallei]KGX96267.1 hypothetical protein Y023_5142 [Burkholderia pseudomallei A79D]KGX97246.1 hypothetical protein X997_4825 [Burkholderia pseudomallei A79C]